MCGLLATFMSSPIADAAASSALACMAQRGPDAEGRWSDAGVLLGHRRLAILDLDRRSAQPMHSTCGRYAIVFNGEVYNYRPLRAALEAKGVVFRTTSDTEVILELFKAEGEGMLPKLQGMFALVIWDKVASKAFAARDPYGIKPLYVGRAKNGVLLASQVKAILATSLVDRAPDPQGQIGFWMLGSVPEPYTWYRDIRAVPAGHSLWIENGRAGAARCWHDIADAWRAAAAQPVSKMPAEEVQARVREALRESVARHLVADVPVGVFLSGGIDSGAMAAMMKEAGVRDLQGVTISYREFAGRHEDEAPVAAELARIYGIHHHVREVGRDEFMADIPRILEAMDQPSIDGINTWYASKAVAEQGLKVVVSGVGGDELFLGYGQFRELPKIVSRWRRLRGVPGARLVAGMLGGVQARRSGNARWRHAAEWLRTMPGAWWMRRSLNAPEVARALMGGTADRALDGFSPESWVHAMSGDLADDLVLSLAQIESTTYLRNQLLRDSDWASMDHSVELRTPLVDAHLLANLTPVLAQFRHFPGKSLLANAPAHPLPDSIANRRKTGFGIPVVHWANEAAVGAPNLSAAGKQGTAEQRGAFLRLVASSAGQIRKNPWPYTPR
jgi:asparagine synthase (glutamine-hydrolysing)